MTPEKVIAQLAELAPYLTFHTEVQLADFGESAAGGAFVKVRIPDPLELEIFRGRTRASKNKQGTRYVMLLVELDDDETAINQDKAERLHQAEEKKGGALSKNAAMLCKDLEFLSYLANRFPNKTWNELSAKGFVLQTCQISSRRELDHNRGAAQRYKSFVQAPFIQWKVGG